MMFESMDPEIRGIKRDLEHMAKMNILLCERVDKAERKIKALEQKLSPKPPTE